VSSFHLVRNPNILERLRQEVSAAPAGADVTREQMQKLPFLRCCLNESMLLLTLKCSNPPLIQQNA
jgi:Cytochrome P450